MGRIKDITGNVYGRLRVLSFDSLSEDDNRAWWNCVCTCGSTLPILGKSLRNGLTQSCGCLQKERATEFSTKHGGVGTPEYNAYRNAQARCTNPKCDKWEYYGGRGIKFCSRRLRNSLPSWASVPEEKLWTELTMTETTNQGMFVGLPKISKMKTNEHPTE